MCLSLDWAWSAILPLWSCLAQQGTCTLQLWIWRNAGHEELPLEEASMPSSVSKRISCLLGTSQWSWSPVMRTYFSLWPFLLLHLSAPLFLLFCMGNSRDSGDRSHDFDISEMYFSPHPQWPILVKCVARRWRSSNGGPMFVKNQSPEELSRDLCCNV